MRQRSNSADKKDVCRNFLSGKCKAGESCTRYHTPPCRFFRIKGGCRHGKDCMFPHVNPHQPPTSGAGAAAATADDKTGDENAGTEQGRGRSRGRSHENAERALHASRTLEQPPSYCLLQYRRRKESQRSSSHLVVAHDLRMATSDRSVCASAKMSTLLTLL